MKPTRCFLRWIFRVAFGILPDACLVKFLSEAAIARANALSPADGLRFLFDLDNRLYHAQGDLSVAYGGGLHSKHRHIRYYDFFSARIQASDRVLDVGCGRGELAYHLAEKTGASILGIDLVPAHIDAARRERAHPHIEYRVGDVLEQLPHEPFSVIVLSNVLEHLSGRAAFLQRLIEATQARRFLIRVPCFERDWRVPLKQELGVEWRLDMDHKTEYALDAFRGEMAAAGLTITHQEVRWGEIWAELRPDEKDGE